MLKSKITHLLNVCHYNYYHFSWKYSAPGIALNSFLTILLYLIHIVTTKGNLYDPICTEGKTGTQRSQVSHLVP